jgi:hypothetical protein
MPSTPTLQQLNSSIISGTLHSTVNNLAASGGYINMSPAQIIPPLLRRRPQMA